MVYTDLFGFLNFFSQCWRLLEADVEYLHVLRMRSLSGDDAFLVHQHLSERADFLANLLLRVPERGSKDTVVRGGTQQSVSSNSQTVLRGTFYRTPALSTEEDLFIILTLIRCPRLEGSRDVKPFAALL